MNKMGDLNCYFSISNGVLLAFTINLCSWFRNRSNTHRPQTRQTWHIQNGALCLLQMWDGCLGHHEHWAHQYIVAPVQILNRTRVDVTCTCGSRVVKEDVKTTEMFNSGFHDTFNVFLYCDVTSNQEYLITIKACSVKITTTNTL